MVSGLSLHTRLALAGTIFYLIHHILDRAGGFCKKLRKQDEQHQRIFKDAGRRDFIVKIFFKN